MTPVPPEFRRKKSSNADGWLSDGRVAIGVAIGMTIALFVWLVLDTQISEPASGDAQDLMPSLAAVVIATISLFLSFFALREQTRMRQAGTDPVLIAHLDQRTDEPMIVVLKLSNVGAGAAMNIRVNAEKPDNAEAARLIEKPFETDVLRGRVPLKVILQGSSVSYTLGTGPQLLGKDSLDAFKVTLQYQDIEGNGYESSHSIDIVEFSGRSADSPPLTKIWRQLEKINKSLSS